MVSELVGEVYECDEGLSGSDRSLLSITLGGYCVFVQLLKTDLANLDLAKTQNSVTFGFE